MIVVVSENYYRMKSLFNLFQLNKHFTQIKLPFKFHIYIVSIPLSKFPQCQYFLVKLTISISAIEYIYTYYYNMVLSPSVCIIEKSSFNFIILKIHIYFVIYVPICFARTSFVLLHTILQYSLAFNGLVQL